MLYMVEIFSEIQKGDAGFTGGNYCRIKSTLVLPTERNLFEYHEGKSFSKNKIRVITSYYTFPSEHISGKTREVVGEFF